MELREALAQITEIRLRMARSEVFWGYQAAPTAFSGVVALAAAGLQAAWIPDAAGHVHAYLGLWIAAAAVSSVAAVTSMFLHYRRVATPLKRQTAWIAAEQLLPSCVAGGLLTLALARFAPETLWLLPGLWQILFSLGLFASCRLMPRAMGGVAVFYLATGVACLALARGEHAFSPWAMGAPFAAGQLLAAVVLYFKQERTDGR